MNSPGPELWALCTGGKNVGQEKVASILSKALMLATENLTDMKNNFPKFPQVGSDRTSSLVFSAHVCCLVHIPNCPTE